MPDQIPWSDLVKQAAEAGIGGDAPLGTHTVEVVNVNSGKTQAGAPKVGLQLKIIEGPQAGATFWDNLVLTMDNPAAVAAFISRAKAYAGSDTIDSLFAAGAGVELIADAIKGAVGSVTVTEGKEKKDGNGHWMNLRFKRSGSTPGAAGVPSFAAPQVTLPAPPVVVSPVAAAPQPTVPAPATPAAVATPAVAVPAPPVVQAVADPQPPDPEPAPVAPQVATDVPF